MAKGLSAESITVAAAELIEQYGRSGFSMRLLADTMGVKTASLYNHIENMDTLLTEVCRYALRMQEDGELRAIAGKTGREAVWALAWAYRRFAQQHRELYWLVMDTAAGEPRVLDDAAARFTEPLKQVLSGFRLPPREEIHFRRMFRAIVHGFASQEDEGFFSHYSGTPAAWHSGLSRQCNRGSSGNRSQYTPYVPKCGPAPACTLF